MSSVSQALTARQSMPLTLPLSEMAAHGADWLCKPWLVVWVPFVRALLPLLGGGEGVTLGAFSPSLLAVGQQSEVTQSVSYCRRKTLTTIGPSNVRAMGIIQ